MTAHSTARLDDAHARAEIVAAIFTHPNDMSLNPPIQTENDIPTNPSEAPQGVPVRPVSAEQAKLALFVNSVSGFLGNLLNTPIASRGDFAMRELEAILREHRKMVDESSELEDTAFEDCEKLRKELAAEQAKSAALRECLAEAIGALKLRIIQPAQCGTVARWEAALSTDAGAALLSELERLRAGKLTDTELQNICHNIKPGDCKAFCDGCAEEIGAIAFMPTAPQQARGLTPFY